MKWEVGSFSYWYIGLHTARLFCNQWGLPPQVSRENTSLKHFCFGLIFSELNWRLLPGIHKTLDGWMDQSTTMTMFRAHSEPGLVIIHWFRFVVGDVCAPSIAAVKTQPICWGCSFLDHPPFVTSSWWNMCLPLGCLNFCLYVCLWFVFVFVRLQLASAVCQTRDRQRCGCLKRMLNKACQP